MATIRRHVGHAIHAGVHRPARQSAVLDLEGGRPSSGKWSKRNVERRVSDWIRRLNDLYDKLDGWIVSVPGFRVRRVNLEQLIENPMKELGVRPRAVPTWTALCGKKRIAFVPSAIWIVGANGRVNVTTNTSQHVLVDLGGIESSPSDWQLVDMNRKSMLRSFDSTAFLELLEE